MSPEAERATGREIERGNSERCDGMPGRAASLLPVKSGWLITVLSVGALVLKKREAS